MTRLNHTRRLALMEEAVTVLFCLIDDAYAHLNPNARRYESLKRLSSLNRRFRKLRRFLEPLRDVVNELVGEPETLIADSTLLSVLHPRQVAQSADFEGAQWARWGSFAVHGMKLHLLCSTNRVLLSCELTVANVADVLLARELLAGAGFGEGGVARRLLGDLAYRSGELGEELARCGILLATEKADRRAPMRQQVEVCFAALKGVFGMEGTLAKTLTGLVTRIAAKVAAYTYGLYVNRLLGRLQGRIKELWA